MIIFAVSPDIDHCGVPAQIAFVSADGQIYPREQFPVDSAIVARALVQLPDIRGLLVFTDDGQSWPFSLVMAQKLVDFFAPKYTHTRHLNALPPKEQAELFELTLNRALELETDMSHIFASCKFSR